MRLRCHTLALVFVLLPGAVIAQSSPPAISVKAGADGRLAYTTDARGNRVVDFSDAGYGGGGTPIPDVPARIVVGADGGNDRARIQAAIDIVSALPIDGRGFRGAVLLEPAPYRIDTHLRIAASGVALRGAGPGDSGTVLIAGGTSRRSLIVVSGAGDRHEVAESRRDITDAYVPVGATSFSVRNAGALTVGDRILVRRPSTKEWIALLGMNTFPGWRPESRLHWQPGSRDIVWDRVITAVAGARITVDAPLTTAIEAEYGGGTVSRYEFGGRIARVGVEHLRVVSEFDRARPWDEDHAWDAVTIDKAEHAWVRQVTAVHFAGHVINALADSKWLTIEDVDALDPVSEVGGFRRRAFYTAGQLTLFQRLRSERGTHDFGVGHGAAGPHVFLDARTSGSLDFSGPIESWASGVLYDNVVVRGNAIRFVNRDVADQGVGWAAANSVIWNGEATDVEVQSPPGAFNQAYGCKGVVTGDGFVYDPRSMPYRDFYRGMPVAPRSLYLAQLVERLGAAAMNALEARPIPTDTAGIRRLTDREIAAFVQRESAAARRATPHPLRVENGTFTIDGQPAWTSRTSYSWFQGQMPPSLAPAFGPAITRFAPGRTGRGYTDDLEAVVAEMKPGGVFYQHYGLWYDRRRVNHNYYGSPERRTGDVWAPFMELPWARSGQGKAWDGLSRYDLTRFNAWYFDRLATFAHLADREGRVLYYSVLLPALAPGEPVALRGLPLAPGQHDPGHAAARRGASRQHVLRPEPPGAARPAPALHPQGARRAGHAHRTSCSASTASTRVRRSSCASGSTRSPPGRWRRGARCWSASRCRRTRWTDPRGSRSRGPLIAAIDFHGWLYRADGSCSRSAATSTARRASSAPDIATPEELEALKRQLGPAALDQNDFRNGPEFQTPVRHAVGRVDTDEVPGVARVPRPLPRPRGLDAARRVPGPHAAGRAADPHRHPARHAPRSRRAFAAGERVVRGAPRRDADRVLGRGPRGRARSVGRFGSLRGAVDRARRGRRHANVARVRWQRGDTLATHRPRAGPLGRLADAGAMTMTGSLNRTTGPRRPLRRIALWLIAGLAVAAAPVGGGQATDWRLDSLTSIGGHPVTLVGAPTVVETPAGPAIAFNGRTDGIFLDVNPLAGLERFTVEVLFEPDADGPPEQRFLHFEEAGGGKRALIETRMLPEGRWCLDTFLKDGDAALTLIDRARTHPAGQWHVAALVYDGREMAHYVDGVRELGGTVAFRPLAAGRTSIGVRQNKVYWFKGRIARVRVTPGVLRPGELLEPPTRRRSTQRPG